VVVLAAALLCACSFDAFAREVTLSIGDLQAGSVSARSVKARLRGANLEAVDVEAERLSVPGRVWRRPRVSCPRLELTQTRAACAAAVLEVGEKIPLSFSYSFEERQAIAEFKAPPDEVWRMQARLGGKRITAEGNIQNARLTRFASLLPSNLPKLTNGRASGNIVLEGDTVKAHIDVTGLAFADAQGLHAGEKIDATVDAEARGKSEEWQWKARLSWRAGEVFWQPFFAAAKGQQLDVQATTARGVTRVRTGTLELPEVATVAFTADWDHAKAAFTSFDAGAKRVRVGPLYENVLKPLVAGTAASDLRAEGEASFAVKLTAAGLTVADVELNDVSFEDRHRRFAVFGLNGRIPWRRDDASATELTLKGAELDNVPIGAIRIPLRLKGTRVAVDRVRVPLLDGALVLRDFAAIPASDGWRWRFSGEVEPISMVQLTQALGVPTMHGVLGGTIPELRYRRGTLSMDGALALTIFDGTVWVSNLQLIDPFGRAPRLHADVDMNHLDLELLTRTFDFGTITGRVDVQVKGLELVGWEPSKFDARIESSPGKYPRKISQRAVENISALGGAGAAAAIQRSFLRFFQQFGYNRLGLSCRLENGVCHMEGIEAAPQGGYVIVKGGGIPAVSVIGYNRAVDWRELIARLKRITQENVKPIVK
jgi:hypothetical protein